MTFIGARSFESFDELLRLHEARDWRSIVNRGDVLLAQVASARESLELRPHAEAMCADAILHLTGAPEGLERFALALSMWPEGVQPHARSSFGSRFVSHAMHAGRYDPAKHEAARLADRGMPGERSAAWRMLAMIAWDTGEVIEVVDRLLEQSFDVDRLTDFERINAEGRARFYQCQFRCMLGDADGAWDVGKRLLEHLDADQRRTPPPSSDRSRWVDRGAALRAVAWSAALAGDLTRGQELLTRSDAETEATSPARQPSVAVARARVLRSLGERVEAETCAEAAVVGGIEHDRVWPQAAGHRELGLLAMDAADHARAVEHLDLALDLFRSLHNPRDETVTGRLLAEARAQR